MRRQAILHSLRPPSVSAPRLASFSRPIPPVYRRHIATTRHRIDSNINSETFPKAEASVEYLPHEDIERPDRYRPGGYHPISIGDCLGSRYDVVHKLGFGTYATTWLARDTNMKKYVAVKIVVADAETSESKILDTLALAEPGDEGQHPGEASIPRVWDTFSLEGPNGRHRCLVTEPGMMTLAEAKDASYARLFRMPVARAIAAQVIQAVAFLHRREIVHADLHAGNIMFRLPKSINELSPGKLYQKHGQPTVEPFARLDGKPLSDGIPTQGVVPIWLGKASELVPLSEAQICVTDFGESFLPSTTQRHYSHTPGILAPPEIYFHEPLSFPSDIWTLACTLWDILGQRPLFEGLNPSDDWMIKEHVDAMGRLPCHWWRRWAARERWFTEEARRMPGGESRSLVDRFVGSIQDPRRECAMEGVGEAEKSALLAMLRGMLALRPSERFTAAEVIGSEWMRAWALPELGKVEF